MRRGNPLTIYIPAASAEEVNALRATLAEIALALGKTGKGGEGQIAGLLIALAARYHEQPGATLKRLRAALGQTDDDAIIL